MGRPAVFLDRDGVINANVFYSDTYEWESPRTVADFAFLPGAIKSMDRLAMAGYRLFIVSNQPNQAKRKSTAEEHVAIHTQLISGLASAGVTVDAAYYCFHHPNGLEPVLSGTCECRKPSPYFLNLAASTYGLDLCSSWMIGDRETDIQCGRAAGVHTIRVTVQPSDTAAEYVAPNLQSAMTIILAMTALNFRQGK